MLAPQSTPKPAEPLSDEEVARRVAAGERALFELLMRRYNQRMFRVARAITRDDSEAEEAMQQAYVNAYVHLGQFAGRAKFSTWLTRITINEALARTRRRELRLADLGEHQERLMLDIESPSPDPEEAAAASQIRHLVEGEIAALPEAYRVVLVMREVEGLSTAETAACFDVADDVVKTRLHRARAMLRERLFRRAGVTYQQLFPFGNERCDRMVAVVMATIESGDA